MHSVVHIIHFVAYLLIGLAKAGMLPKDAAIGGYAALTLAAFFIISHALALVLIRHYSVRKVQTKEQSNPTSGSLSEGEAAAKKIGTTYVEVEITRETIRISHKI